MMRAAFVLIGIGFVLFGLSHEGVKARLDTHREIFEQQCKLNDMQHKMNQMLHSEIDLAKGKVDVLAEKLIQANGRIAHLEHDDGSPAELRLQIIDLQKKIKSLEDRAGSPPGWDKHPPFDMIPPQNLPTKPEE